VLRLSPADALGPGRRLRVELVSKHGVRPFLNGMNHVISQDDEPIDRFVLAVSADPPPDAPSGAEPELLLVREILNDWPTRQNLCPPHAGRGGIRLTTAQTIR
jgi:hypothetical protein